MNLKKIVSGGQTGADRAALNWALQHGVPHGGWCPKGRTAEDGTIEPRFQLQETPEAAYSTRTRWNVRDSDGTVILSLDSKLTGGSALTLEFARQLAKPALHLYPDVRDPGTELRRFLEEHHIQTLNVAGPRESSEAGIGAFVTKVLDEACLRPIGDGSN